MQATDQMIILGRAPNRIDVLTRPKGLDFAACRQAAVDSDYAGEPIKLLSLEDLIRAKRAAGRPQDLVDAQKLEMILERRR
jgi:hypothetical protein